MTPSEPHRPDSQELPQATHPAAPAGAHQQTPEAPTDAGPETEPDTSSEAAPEPEAGADPAAELPAISSMTLETDLAQYLKPGVPAAIRNAAMRRKWLLNPVIRDYVDPALDYAWDWNSTTPVPGTGGRMLSESVAKMLRDVVGTPKTDTHADREAPVADSNPPEPGGDAADPAPEVRVDDGSAGPPVGSDSGGVVSQPDGPQGPTAQVEPAQATQPRRRHGGAMPS